MSRIIKLNRSGVGVRELECNVKEEGSNEKRSDRIKMLEERLRKMPSCTCHIRLYTELEIEYLKGVLKEGKG